MYRPNLDVEKHSCQNYNQCFTYFFIFSYKNLVILVPIFFCIFSTLFGTFNHTTNKRTRTFFPEFLLPFAILSNEILIIDFNSLRKHVIIKFKLFSVGNFKDLIKLFSN